MANSSLVPTTPLACISLAWGDSTLSEEPGLSLVSLSIPLGGDEAFEAELLKGYGMKRPAIGASSIRAGKTLMALAHDQFFLTSARKTDAPCSDVKSIMGDAAYLTDQSDAWCALRCSGPLTRQALERICPLNLSHSAFPKGAVARTTMEHLGVLIMCENDDVQSPEYLMLSARSSADSFLHAVKISFENVA